MNPRKAGINQIFVEGVPNGISLLELFISLRKHCYILSIDGHSCTKNHSTLLALKISMGHCLLKVSDKKDRDALIGMKTTRFRQRTLFFSPYLEGQDLYKHNNLNNKTKVLIKEVPIFLNEIDLIQALERDFGKVNNVFAYNEPCSEFKRKNRNHRTYSVEFMDEYIAKSAAAVGRLKISPKYAVLIEKYSIKFEKSKNNKPHNDSHSAGYVQMNEMIPNPRKTNNLMKNSEKIQYHQNQEHPQHFKNHEISYLGHHHHIGHPPPRHTTTNDHCRRPCDANYDSDIHAFIHDKHDIRINKQRRFA